MKWNNPEQIAAYFDLQGFEDGDLAALRRAVVKKMASIHPDKNPEKFSDPKNEELWHELNSAKEFIQDEAEITRPSSSGNEMIPISQVTELVKLITQSNSVPAATRVSELKNEARQDAHSRGFIPRVGSGAFAAVSAFLFTFSSSAKDHPLLGEWLQTTTAQYVLLVAMLYSGMFFVMTWARERRQEGLVEFLCSEEGLRETMIRLLDGRSDRNHPRKFTLREFTEQLRPSRHRAHYSPLLVLFGGQHISRSIADQISSVQLERLTKRGIVVELPDKGLDRAFEVSRSAYDAITNQSED